MSVSLIYIPSWAVVDYIASHPVNWLDAYKHMAQRGGIGDTAGVTPTPAVYEFLSLYHETKGLFTQRDYMTWCFDQWGDWLSGKTKQQQDGVAVKLYRNFYPSMIDSLHTWALLCETGQFDACILDSTHDAIGKTDLTLSSFGNKVRVALLIETPRGVADRAYKLNARNKGEGVDCLEVLLPMSRPKSPGNKRWYMVQDFAHVVSAQFAAAAD